ncbi:hypothetical protein L7F22_049710 [Adiantum nelumboides]|nr:hypothetical protein [Adiantum nelumboides]
MQSGNNLCIEVDPPQLHIESPGYVTKLESTIERVPQKSAATSDRLKELKASLQQNKETLLRVEGSNAIVKRIKDNIEYYEVQLAKLKQENPFNDEDIKEVESQLTHALPTFEDMLKLEKEVHLQQVEYDVLQATCKEAQGHVLSVKQMIADVQCEKRFMLYPRPQVADLGEMIHVFGMCGACGLFIVAAWEALTQDNVWEDMLILSCKVPNQDDGHSSGWRVFANAKLLLECIYDEQHKSARNLADYSNIHVKRKTTGCFSAQPYLFSLLSSMLWTYYGTLNHTLLLITISCISSAFYSFYITLYLWFGSKPQREKTGWFLFAIVCFFVSMIISTRKLLHGSEILMAIGLLCTVVSVFANAAPLSIIRRVVRTKSVQYMPLSLSICLFLNGVTWLAYGLCLQDMFLIITNGVGVSLGMLQLALYTFYRVYGVHMHQVTDENDLSKVASKENMDMEVKVSSGRTSRTSSAAGGMDFNINIRDASLDLPPQIEQTLVSTGSLRKLPTPRAIVIDAHVILEDVSSNTS